MDKKRILIALVLGLIAFFIFKQARNMSKPQPVDTTPVVETVVKEVEYIDVLVAAVDIPAGSRISDAHFKWAQWPKDAPTHGFITNESRPEAISELTGRIVESEIYENEPIIEQKFVSADNANMLSARLTPGMRAVSIVISDETAVAGFIQPGDYVDVIHTTQQDPGSLPNFPGASNNGFVARTIFERVKVLAIGSNLTTTADSGPIVMGATATLEVSPSDAEKLRQTQSEGDVALVLRPFGDKQTRFQSLNQGQITDNQNTSSIAYFRGGELHQVPVSGQ